MYEDSVRHTTSGIQASGLGKQFGDLWALRNLDLDVKPGTVLGLLGHNGAGKTTAIRILTTLALPSEGSASVAGFDVVKNSAEVRQRIGVASQQATVDGLLNAKANLEMVGRLFHLPKAEARRRADDLLEALNLTEANGKLVKTFSGGMRRRLDLAASIVAHPEVLFLDEPTTGLDPLSRNELWEILRGLTKDGTTIVLTTQYLEEADQLADDIIVLDHGETVAHGTPSELKAQIGRDRVDIKLAKATDLTKTKKAFTKLATNTPTVDKDELLVTAALKDGTKLIDVLKVLADAGVDPVDINRREASLDDVFLTLTTPGRRAAEEVSV